MHAGARHLTSGVKTGNRGPPPEIALDASHDIVRAWGHRDPIAPDVEAVAGAGRGNGRKALPHERAVQVAHAEIDRGVSGAAHLGHDTARHDVARRQVTARIVTRHEALAGVVFQPSPFAAHRLRQQEARCPWERQGRRMELDKLHVRHLGAGPVGHGHAVARRLGRVGGLQVRLSGAAGRQHDRPGAQDDRPGLVLVQGEDPGAAAPRQDQVDREDSLQKRDSIVGARPGDQGAHDLAPGRVAAGPEDAPLAVRRLPGQGDTRPLPVETGTPVDQLQRAPRALLDQHPDSPLMTQTVARRDRVLEMQGELIVVRKNGGHPALGLVAGRVARTVLGQDRHPPATPRNLEGGSEPGNAASRNDGVETRFLPHRIAV